MNSQEKVIFDGQEVSKFGRSAEKPFIGGVGSIITSLLVLSLVGVALYFLFHSNGAKPEPTPIPTPSFEQRIRESAEKLAQEKLVEMGHTDTWRSESEAAEELERQARQKRENAEEASRLANLSRERQQTLVNDMDLYRQRLLPSQPLSQPTDSPER